MAEVRWSARTLGTLAAIACAACTGSDRSSVRLDPPAVTLVRGGTQTFVARVTGSLASDVEWLEPECDLGPGSCGAVAGGVFHAPHVIPGNSRVVVSARSVVSGARGFAEVILVPFELEPSRGPRNGGTRLRVSGYGFTPGTSVFFGDAPGDDVVVHSFTELEVTTPPSATGIGGAPVVVQPGGGGAALTHPEGFRYSAGPLRFGGGQLLDVCPIPRALATGLVLDEDGDGADDVMVFPCGGLRRVEVVRRDPAGGFEPPRVVQIPGAISADRVSAADVDGDGDLDLGVFDRDGRFLHVLFAGNGTFQAGLSVALPAEEVEETPSPSLFAPILSPGPVSAILAEWNGSAVVVAVMPTSGVKIVRYDTGDPAGSIGGIFSGVFRAELDGVPPEDLIFVASTSLSVHYAGDPLTALTTIGVAGVQRVAAGDFDDDGDLDLALLTAAGTALVRNLAKGDLKLEGAVGGAGALGLAAADLDGEGADELVGPSPGGTGLAVFYDPFAAAPMPPVPVPGALPATSDVLAFARGGQRFIARRAAAGPMALEILASRPDRSIGPPPRRPVATRGVACADGRVAVTDGNDVLVLPAGLDLAAATAERMDTGGLAHDLRFVDHDGVTPLDLIVPTSNPAGVYFADASNGFSAGSRLELAVPGIASTSVTALGRLDADLARDVVLLAGQSSPKAYFYASTSFHPVAGILASTDVEVGPIDADPGHDELVTSEPESGVVLVVDLSSPAGGAAVSAALPVAGSNPADVALFDVDGDGDLDVVVTATYLSNAGEIDVFRNDGTGAFAPAEVYRLERPLLGPVGFGDVDLDDLPDLIARLESPPSIGVLRNLGGGRFASIPEESPVVDGDGVIAACDLDGDGLTDVAIGGLVSGLGAYRNQSN